MEQPQTEVQEPVITTPTEATSQSREATSPGRPAAAAVTPQACATCGTAPASNGGAATSPSWVYAIGNIEARFPTICVEKECAQATGRADTAGNTDRQALHTVLSKPENRYLVRQCCFVMTVEGLETYILKPRDPADYSLLVEAVRPNPLLSARPDSGKPRGGLGLLRDLYQAELPLYPERSRMSEQLLKSMCKLL